MLVINSNGLVTISMIGNLSTWQWLATPEGEELMGRVCASPTVAEISSLRKKWDADQVRLAIELLRARAKSEKKYPGEIAQRLIGDDQGIQMASSLVASEYKARRFLSVLGDGAKIADLCCGIGGDSLGFSRAGLDVTGFDLDPVRVWMTERNAGVRGIVGDVCRVDCGIDGGAGGGFDGGFDGFHLDPSRRDLEGMRTREGSEFEPGVEDWEGIVERFGCGCIKVGPGVDAEMFGADEFEVLSESGSLTQGLLWYGKMGTQPRRATRIERDGRVWSIAGEPGRPETSCEIGAYIGAVDPSVERVDLVRQLVEESGCQLVHPGTGLLTWDQVPAHGMLTPFAVLDVMAWRFDAVRKALRGYDAGIVEVKTRGGVVDTDVVQRKLRGKGDRALVVFVYRFGKAVKAIIAERVQVEKTSLLGAKTC